MSRQVRDSGVAWLGDIPAHWEIRRLKNVGTAKIGLTYSPDDIVDQGEGMLVLRASNIQRGRVVYKDNVFVNRKIPSQLILRKGDVLICSRSGSRELIGKNAMIDCDSEGFTFGTFMTVFRSEYNDYVYRVFNSAFFQYHVATFATSTVNQITLEILLDLKIPFPPLPEQRAIADYLDTETTRIDTLIEKKRRLIDLLAERRQAIITEAVTKGLDHTVAMKDSGVEWLGEIPAHWDVKRLKHVATIRVSNVDKHIVDGQPTVRLVNYTDVYYNDLITPNMQLMVSTADRDKLNKYRVLAGDSIITKDSETPDDIGVPAYVKEADPDMVCGYHLAILRPLADLTLTKFVFYATKSSSSAEYWSSMASGLTRYGLKIDAIGSCALPIPPLHEQRAITGHLDYQTQRIDALVEKLERQIDLLTERRQAVITSAVTGKLDVSDRSFIKGKRRNL